MPPLRSIDFGRVRRLAGSTALPSINLNTIYNLTRNYNPIPSQSHISNLIEYGLIERGITPSSLQLSSPDVESNLTKGQKQVETLKRRLQESGHEVPEPDDAGREGLAGRILNWLGAPSGAITTLVYDLINRDGEISPLRSLREGFTGKDRKIGSDILEELGVENKVAKGIGGFALDVLLDPTTYLGIGLARNIGTTAARELAQESLERAGLNVSDETELARIMDEAIGVDNRGVKITNDERVATVAQAFGRPVAETTQDGGIRQFSISGQPNISVQTPASQIATTSDDAATALINEYMDTVFDDAVGFTLPRNLQSAKPRYSYGTKQFTLNFERDFEKAAYIIGSKNKSKRYDDYLRAVQSSVNVSEEVLKMYGQRIRDYLKSIAKNRESGGVINVPKIIPRTAPKITRTETPKITRTETPTPTFQPQRAVDDVDTGKEITQYTLYASQPNIPRQITLQAGIPFTNAQIDLANLTPMMERISEAARSLPSSNSRILSSIGRAGQLISRQSRNLFRKYPIPSSLANLFKQRDYAVNTAHRRAIQVAENLDKKLGGGYRRNPDVHRAIAFSLDMPRVGDQLMQQLPDDVRKTAIEVRDQLKKEFEQIEKLERRLGISDPDKVREFYFPHLLTGDPDALRAARAQIGGATSYIPTIGRFQMERTFPDLKELQRFVDRFNAQYQGRGRIEVNLDIGQVLATRQLASQVLQQNKKLIDRMKNLDTNLIRPLDEAAGNPNYTQLTDVRGLEDVAVHNDIVKFIQEWDKISTPSPDFNQLVNTIGNVTRMWKGSVTWTSQHLFNNALGAIWNNWIMGVKNPRDYFNAISMLGRGQGRRLEPNTEALNAVEIQLPNGSTMNGTQIIQLAEQFNIIRAGSEADFIGRRLDRAGSTPRWRKAAGFVQTAAEYIEDTARLAGFMNMLRRTGDPWEASLEVKKHLFDYNELSRFERDFIGQFIPFYAWLRKNIPLQLEALVRKPGMFTGMEHAIAEGAAMAGIDLEDAPGYIANAATIPLFRTDDGNVIFVSPYALPANDLFEAFQAFDSPTEFGRYLGQQVAPWFRYIPEVAFNQQFFSGIPIDTEAAQSGEDVGWTSPEALNYLFSQIGLPYNIARSFGRRELIPTGEERSEDQFVSRTVGGGPFSVDNLLSLTGAREYNPQYWEEEVLPYQYAKQLRGEIRRLTKRGETVYTKTELDQAEELGLSPEQVRILRNILEEQGMQKSKKNIHELLYQMMSQQ